MTRFCLIIETPRGGEIGHRFVVSNTDLSERAVACAANDASSNAVGANYISVSHQVTQRLPNGAVRNGAERIILMGVDVRQIGPEAVERVKAQLANLIPKVGNLIESIDWSAQRRSVVTGRQELRDWVNDNGFPQLPQFKVPEETRLPRGARWKWLLFGTILLVAGAMTWLSFVDRSSQPERNTGQSRPSAYVHLELFVRELAKDWGCSPENVIASLLKASNWDRRQEANAMNVVAGLADGEILAALSNLKKSKGSNRFFISPSLRDADGLRRFIGAHPTDSSRDTTRVRMWMHDTWLHFSNVHHAAKKAENALKLAQIDNAVSRLLAAVAKLQMDAAVGDQFQKPMTPLFDRQDVMIFGVLEDYRRIFDDEARFDEAGAGGHVTMPASRDLWSFRHDLRLLRESINGDCAKLCYSASDKVGGQGAAEILDACKALELFHEQLSKDPKP